jgi:hypothetical protein
MLAGHFLIVDYSGRLAFLNIFQELPNLWPRG